MSDEEKEAIEYLKRHILPYYGSKGRIEFMLNDIILNLIETQQKEIEELKETLKCTQNSWFEDTQKIEEMKKQLDLDKDKYISNDKIKAKIEEIKNDCKKCRFRGFCEDLLKNNQCSQGEAIKVLKELLEG